jgi:hypothetical protein
MKGRLFKILCAISLLLCILTIAIWVWSCWVSQGGFIVVRARQMTICHFGFGELAVLRVRDVPTPNRIHWFDGYFLGDHFGLPIAPGALSAQTTQSDWHTRFLGIQYLSGKQEYFPDGQHEFQHESSLLIVPCWLVSVATGWPMWFVIRGIRRRFRRLPGFCVRCGYDLRATPDRCPECGTARAAE